jgi:hypothetical protein
MVIDLITCDSGDWDVLAVDGEIYYEGTEIPDHVWLELLETKLNVVCKGWAISDKQMENRTFEKKLKMTQK